MFLKKNIAVIIGNSLEYYDFMLYGFFAAILAPLFFPSDIPNMSLIMSMGSYGIGFLARPLGGIFFGHIGDRRGRKDALSLSILLVALPTLGIALLPTYHQIGVWAPLLLILCRFLQGFCLGGETSGAMTYIIENTVSSERDKVSAWFVVSCYVGTLVGTLLGAFFTLSFMPSWGWRLTFVIGSLIALIGYYIRKRLKESPEFLQTQEKKKIQKIPLLELFRNEKINLLCVAGIAAAVVIPFIIIFIYLNGIFIKNLHLKPSSVLALNAGLMCFWIALLPFFGYLSQKYGRKPVMKAGLMGMAFASYPLFFLIGSEPNFNSIVATQLILSFFAISYAAPTSALLVELFSVNERYSGIAFGYSLGHAIFGGLTPITLTILSQSFGLTFTPVICLVVASLFGSLALYKDSLIHKNYHQLKINA